MTAYVPGKLVLKQQLVNDFTPAELSPTMWFDGADETTVTLNGGLVSEWRDKSGNSFNATQADPGLQPTYTVAGLNGKNILLATAPRRLLINNQTYSNGTIFIVCNDTKETGFGVAFVLTDGSKTFSLLSNLANNDWGSYLDGPRTANGNIGPDFAIASIESDPTDLSFYLNAVPDGVLSSIATRSVFSTSSIFNDEYNSYHQGNIAEIVFYDKLLSVDDRFNKKFTAI